MTRYEALEKLLELPGHVSEEYADAQRAGCDPNAAWDCARHELRRRVDELRALLANVREREAVAWWIKSDRGNFCSWDKVSVDYWKSRKDVTITPLYTSPPSQQAVDVEGAAQKALHMMDMCLESSEHFDMHNWEQFAVARDELRHSLSGKHLVSPREGWVLPAHKCGLFLTHNEHRDYYMPLSEWIEEQSGDDGEKPWGSPDQEAKCLATDELWELHWYPETPIGSYRVWAASLEELLRFANEPEASPPLAPTMGEKK